MSTRGERKLLLVFAFIFMALFVGIAASEIYSMIPRPRKPGAIEFAADHYRPLLAGFHLMTPIVFLSLILARRYIVSTALTVLYALLLVASFSARLDGRGGFGEEGFFAGRRLDEIYLKLHEYDFVAIVFVSILLVRQISILLRNFGGISKLSGRKHLP